MAIEVKKTRAKRWGGGYTPRRKVCSLCIDKTKTINYKEPFQLRQYVSGGGKIEPRRKTGVCARHQRALAVAIKRARHLALLPYVPAHTYKAGSIGKHE